LTVVDNTLDSAEALIQLQAKINERIIDLARILSARTEVKSVDRRCEVRCYRNKTIFEACVDVETKRDVAISFWFELGCENKAWWVIASINRTLRDDQHRLDEYPGSSPENLDQLERVATQASGWLAIKAKEFAFGDLIP
jgi:hypothetical protein